MNYYQILGVKTSASLGEIKKAYRRLSVQWHPDKHSDEELQRRAQERFSKISTAYDVLSNPAKRSQYDQQLSARQVMNLDEVVNNIVDAYVESLIKQEA